MSTSRDPRVGRRSPRPGCWLPKVSGVNWAGLVAGKAVVPVCIAGITGTAVRIPTVKNELVLLACGETSHFEIKAASGEYACLIHIAQSASGWERSSVTKPSIAGVDIEGNANRIDCRRQRKRGTSLRARNPSPTGVNWTDIGSASIAIDVRLEHDAFRRPGGEAQADGREQRCGGGERAGEEAWDLEFHGVAGGILDSGF